MAEPRRSKVISAQPLDVIPKMENMSNQKRKEMFFPETFHLAERKWNVSFFGCVGVHLPRNVHLPSFRHLSAWRNKSGKSVQAPRPMFRFLSTRWHFGGTQTVESDLRTISRCHTKNGKCGGRSAGTRSLFWHLPTTKAVAARTRGGHVLGGVAHGGVCFYIRIANTELEHKRHCHNTPRRCPCCLPRRCPRCQPPKRSARGCEAVMRRRCVRGLLPLASQCKCNLTHIVSRTQPSPLCFASRTSSSAPSHPPRRPRPRGASGHLRSLLSALRPSGGFMAPG